MGHLPTVLRWLLMVTAVCWVALEVRHSLLSRRPEARRADRGSRPVIGVAAAIGLLLGLGAAQVVPGLAVGDRVVAAWCALVLLWVAMALRFWSVQTLGRYFTLTVQTSPDQPVVTTGPYRYVRHPAYSALLIAVVAGGLLIGNWASMVVLLAAVGAGLAYRISVEEQALARDIGGAYRDYAATHKRLVPFVW
jgi:protein-S-isoprenylcysteine O-methyltransferase Ste14